MAKVTEITTERPGEAPDGTLVAVSWRWEASTALGQASARPPAWPAENAGSRLADSRYVLTVLALLSA